MLPKRPATDADVRKRQTLEPAPLVEIVKNEDVPVFCSALPHKGDVAAIDTASEERHNPASYLSLMPLDMFRGLMSERFLRTKPDVAHVPASLALRFWPKRAEYIGSRRKYAYFFLQGDPREGADEHIIKVSDNGLVKYFPLIAPADVDIDYAILGDLNQDDFGFYCCARTTDSSTLLVFSKKGIYLRRMAWEETGRLKRVAYMPFESDETGCISVATLTPDGVRFEQYECNMPSGPLRIEELKFSTTRHYVSSIARGLLMTENGKFSVPTFGMGNIEAVSWDGSGVVIPNVPTMLSVSLAQLNLLHFLVVSVKDDVETGMFCVGVPNMALAVGFINNHCIAGLTYNYDPETSLYLIDACIVK